MNNDLNKTYWHFLRCGESQERQSMNAQPHDPTTMAAIHQISL